MIREGGQQERQGNDGDLKSLYEGGVTFMGAERQQKITRKSQFDQVHQTLFIRIVSQLMSKHTPQHVERGRCFSKWSGNMTRNTFKGLMHVLLLLLQPVEIRLTLFTKLSALGLL